MFREKGKNQYRPKPPRGPVRLAFGLIEEKKPENEDPVPAAVAPRFPAQEIVGTLVLKKVDLDRVSPLKQEHVARVLENLAQIYEEGQSTRLQTVVDCPSENLLHVSFHYNQNVIDRIKGFDRNERQWDPDLRVWKVFIGCFDDLFDILGKGFCLTEPAYQALQQFITTPYYAFIAPKKIGKLVLRESWFEKFQLDPLPLQDQSLQERQENEAKLRHIRSWIENFPFLRKPYSHQLVGIEFLLTHPCCALLDEMGCGKSFQIASAVAMLLHSQSIDRCLIVAPKSLIATWQQELSLAAPSVPCTVVEGSPVNRAKRLQADTPLFLIHYEGLRLEQDSLAQWMNSGSGMVVFDESQRIKNIAAQTTLSAKQVRNKAQRCVIATGTPIANRPLDLFAQYYVMDSGATFGSNFTAFKNTFCILETIEMRQGRRLVKVEKFLGVRNGDELRKRIQRTSLRRLKSEVLDLPPVVIKNYSVELKAEQKSLYAKVRASVRREVENMGQGALSFKAIDALFLRLAQIASNPLLFEKSFVGANAKFSELETLLADIFSDETKKIILWSHFVENVKTLTQVYADVWGAVSHTGDMSTHERSQSVESFQNDPACRLFIATPQSAKEGLTLLPKDGVMRADTMIYLDLSFDSGSYVQSQARFHRIGQNSEKCLVIHLLGLGTIDEYIKKTLVDKIQTAIGILDQKNKESEERLRALASATVQFSKDELLSFL